MFTFRGRTISLARSRMIKVFALSANIKEFSMVGESVWSWKCLDLLIKVSFGKNLVELFKFSFKVEFLKVEVFLETPFKKHFNNVGQLSAGAGYKKKS